MQLVVRSKRASSRLPVVLSACLIIVVLSFSAVFFLEKPQVSTITLTVRQNTGSISSETMLTGTTTSAGTAYSVAQTTITQTTTIIHTMIETESTFQTQDSSTSSNATPNATLISCQFSLGNKICTYQYNEKYSTSFVMLPGADCAYNGNTPYLMNGSVFAYWNYLFFENQTKTNYFTLNLIDFQVLFQNGTIFANYNGILPYNLTSFSVLANQTVILDTKQVNLNLNPCFPFSLFLKPDI